MDTIITPEIGALLKQRERSALRRENAVLRGIVGNLAARNDDLSRPLVVPTSALERSYDFPFHLGVAGFGQRLITIRPGTASDVAEKLRAIQ
jgi:hypothetical protein